MTDPDHRRSLVRGRHILLKSLDDDTVDVLDDGAILQVDGRIQEIGRFAELSSRHPDVAVLGSSDHIVIPGLVNAHHHIGMTPVQLGSPDMPLELWLTHHVRHRDVDPYLDTLYSAFELVASGVTAVQHLGGMKPGPVRSWPANASEIIRAYVDLGMRVSFAFCNRDQHRLVYGDDATFVASLPEGLRGDVSAFLERTHFRLEDYETEYLQPMIERFGKEPLVRIWLAPINLERSSDRLLTLTRDWLANTELAFIFISRKHLIKRSFPRVGLARRRLNIWMTWNFLGTPSDGRSRHLVV